MSTSADTPVPVSPLCAQQTLTSLRTLKISRPLFDRRWHGNTPTMHNSSSIVTIMTIATSSGRRKRIQTDGRTNRDTSVRKDRQKGRTGSETGRRTDRQTDRGNLEIHSQIASDPFTLIPHSGNHSFCNTKQQSPPPPPKKKKICREGQSTPEFHQAACKLKTETVCTQACEIHQSVTNKDTSGRNWKDRHRQCHCVHNGLHRQKKKKGGGDGS